MPDLLSILFVPEPNRKVSIGSIQLDATVSENHQYKSNLTQHPIETGGNVADHIYHDPVKLTMEGEVTNTPVSIFSILGGISDRRIEAFEQLIELRNARQLVTVVTGLKVYENLVIVGLTFPRDNRTGRRLQFTADFESAEFVASQIVGTVPEKVAAPQKDQAQDEVAKGRQEATPANPAQEAQSTKTQASLASKGFDFLLNPFTSTPQ